MTALGSAAAEFLTTAGISTQPGLTQAELTAVERHWGIRFAADHRSLLTSALPVGDGWVDWRNGDEAEIASRLTWPRDGMLFDVEHDAFWPTDWGVKPDHVAEAMVVAAEGFRSWTPLVPIYSHRYVPAGAPEGAPVFSVYQTDVILYGANLLDYLRREFGAAEPEPTVQSRGGYEPWGKIAEGWGQLE